MLFMYADAVSKFHESRKKTVQSFSPNGFLHIYALVDGAKRGPQNVPKLIMPSCQAVHKPFHINNLRRIHVSCICLYEHICIIISLNMASKKTY